MDQLVMIAEKQDILLRQLRAGDLFESLPDLLRAIRDEVEYEEPTPVTPVLSADEAINRMAWYQENWNNQGEAESILFVSKEDLRRFLTLLSSTDESIRDSGTFFFLGSAIQNNHIEAETLDWLTRELIHDSRLFSHLFEEENDGAYYRSYSMAVLALLLSKNADNTETFISEELMSDIVQQLGIYMLVEKDTRGFVEGHGWIHAYTHLANVLGQLFEQLALKRADKLYLLACLMTNLRSIDTPLTMGEMGRLVGNVLQLSRRHKIYADYLLLALKLWRQDLVNTPFKQDRSNWQMLYIRVDFFQQILAFGPDASPQDVWNYAQATKNYLS
ncbi:DUF2785 domain-containing protein [Fructobacillus sp. CRL 2054]|uniref:DUF2785 domain-containing protein n=1 Tax=Fructobacillus sp. CRL 2054 TaxID=2763007 RepID=UPI002379CC5D|nr:DUF2785 domain-containing protein [Fructobacillus sp. CRL 2054]MDD9138572.1 DUF2785 domain-containing protein [Fructobacillus sp. CRL 2054]